MADFDRESRTEEPTPRREEKAREEGLKEKDPIAAECQARAGLESEADTYAVVLLTNLQGPIPMEMVGMDKITGYDNFFRYVYQLGGFPEDRQQDCSYPDLDQRRILARSVEEAIWQKKEDALSMELDKQFIKLIEKSQ